MMVEKIKTVEAELIPTAETVFTLLSFCFTSNKITAWYYFIHTVSFKVWETQIRGKFVFFRTSEHFCILVLVLLYL